MLRSNIIHWQGVKDIVDVMIDHPKGITESSKELCIADKGQNKLEPPGECISMIIIIFKLKKEFNLFLPCFASINENTVHSKRSTYFYDQFNLVKRAKPPM